ncbi:hypothetical protein ICN48_10115 [Polynucleobacter sp. JS-Safj-400b-B2]|nr:hypothetical protein [Polynucleobacter sp. JS-Safj-400b-B2]MBU3626584.1 hypothetical protein [Polynucleobacter sp. JS-Safj-400b-B2]
MASGMMLGMKSEQVRNVVHLLLVVGGAIAIIFIAVEGGFSRFVAPLYCA